MTTSRGIRGPAGGGPGGKGASRSLPLPPPENFPPPENSHLKQRVDNPGQVPMYQDGRREIRFQPLTGRSTAIELQRASIVGPGMLKSAAPEVVGFAA